MAKAPARVEAVVADALEYLGGPRSLSRFQQKATGARTIEILGSRWAFAHHETEPSSANTSRAAVSPVESELAS